MFTCSRDYVLQVIGSLMKYYSSDEIEKDAQEKDPTDNEEDEEKKRKSKCFSSF